MFVAREDRAFSEGNAVLFVVLEVESAEAVALFDYVGRTEKELSFKRYQLIHIYKKMNHEWWQGCLAGGNELGYVPDGYIKLKVR